MMKHFEHLARLLNLKELPHARSVCASSGWQLLHWGTGTDDRKVGSSQLQSLDQTDLLKDCHRFHFLWSDWGIELLVAPLQKVKTTGGLLMFLALTGDVIYRPTATF